MEFSTKVAVILVLLNVSLTTAQNTTEIFCSFEYHGSLYTCYISGHTVTDNEHQLFNIRGNHNSLHFNSDVENIVISSSHIPFIITPLFTTFPNVRSFEIWNDDGLNRVQWRAFYEARNLRTIFFLNNPQLNTIEEYAFSGASNLTEITIDNSTQLGTIEANAFSGTDSLTRIVIMRNQQLAIIGANTFNGAGNLSSVSITRNSELSTIGEKAFNGVSNLTEIVITLNPQLKTIDNCCQRILWSH